ncbi:gamma-glutamylcyclotransferase family protein [Clostridium botulinum]|uniref:gamma-glutamylcyclotransferase family protein n=1 Tax=Clostridium botulinum TaxID=1491 RepID=UPI0007741C9B|nr:gamma-glutamylcyclotransferase family protein [Clostridium botulinum]NFE94350.1 gamma-glutamylcyclotransferase [Clostridium botulinum]NFL37836.1 gamma-glutamylcyclotransferase [Clostridium botulinum]NFL64126.1 gamma-glutamylcyclotransferase [Clostridium botulinum]NFN07742.1 gamma-glutamylcyclotransferase [Clostridium botulinum]NFN23977.1 gamma-glutamylcyclotransferase [Clostridium botulinum]
MAEKVKLYGAYGSNMNLEQMNDRCPKAMVVGNGILEGYKLTFRGKYKGVANIEPCKGRSVPIVLWEITQDCERALDLYEGYPRLYVKKEVQVKVKDKLIKAMVYVMASEYTNMAAAPTEYYFNVIARGYSDNEVDLKPLQIAYSECLSELK